jgi:4-amino-4-deoxy-L-arabinose transferase-like glycosyltransferase
VPNRNLATLATWATLALAIALNIYLQYPFLANHGQDWDAIHLYQPLAKDLLEDGVSFFGEEASVMAPPFSYAWQAMFGASLDAVRWANLVLSVFTLCLLFRSAWLLHSRLAGLIAALLFAKCPLLKEFIAAPITEGPFIFLCACWFWALCEWFRGGRRAFVIVAGVALALSVLTRASLEYWIFIGIVAFGWLALRRHGEERRRARGALAAHVIAMAAQAAVIAKNYAIFGIAFVATGAGNALYQGNHPITGGYDADFVGLPSDLMQITRVPYHLYVEPEKRLMTVARGLIRDSDPVSLAELHVHKLAAFLFITKAYPGARNLRSWRVALLILAAVGFACIRDPWMRWLLAGILAYQIVSYVPVLYTHRYSITIDPWLMIAAGVGVAALWARRRPLEIAAAAAALVIGVGIARYLTDHMDAPEPNVFGGARFLDWQGEPRRIVFDTDHPSIDVAVRNAPLLDPVNVNVLVLDYALTPAESDPACGAARITYQRNNGGASPGEITARLVPDGRLHRHQFGTLPLELNAEGTLRMQLDCAKGGSLDIRRIAVYTPVAGMVYAERYLGLKPLVRVPVEE